MAINSKDKPFIISDMGDNPTAGGAGDVTWTLKQILDNSAFKKGGPIMLKGVVESIRQGDKDAQTEVVVSVGSVKVIVTGKRKPYHYLADFTNLGLDPRI